MTYLLDTQMLLWSLLGQPELPKAAQELLLDPRHTFAYSAVSTWEVGIKHAKHPVMFTMRPERIAWAVQELGYAEIAITSQHAIVASGLPFHHRDPFDRMLAAQAAVEQLILLTADRVLAKYGDFVQLV